MKTINGIGERIVPPNSEQKDLNDGLRQGQQTIIRTGINEERLLEFKLLRDQKGASYLGDVPELLDCFLLVQAQ